MSSEFRQRRRCSVGVPSVSFGAVTVVNEKHFHFLLATNKVSELLEGLVVRRRMPYCLCLVEPESFVMMFSLSAQHLGLRRIAAIALATVVLGVATGLAGIALSYLLHGVQHLAYGYSPGQIISRETFLDGVSASPPWRRLCALVVCGLVGGGGWWLLFRYGRPLVNIKKAVEADDPRMPLLSTFCHVLLQIVTVALGSPLGREVAPREAGAAMAGWLGHRLQLAPRDRQILVACAAGAGLAAVYNVPLAGALFTMEVLLGSFAWWVAAPAVTMSTLAAVVAWIGLGNEHQYQVPAWSITPALIVWALLSGPLFGAVAWGYSEIAKRARARAPKRWPLPLLMLINCAVIGVFVIWFPQLPGNGKGAASLSFDNRLGIGLAAVLFALKMIFTTSSLRAGASGGLLTPGLANGALLAIVLGGGWNMLWPGTSPGAFAIVGATAFLASSMQMPLTAIMLVFEFTRIDHDFLVPMLLAVAGALVTFRLIGHAATAPLRD
jgi:H+/Cl- antiporter ClcA